MPVTKKASKTGIRMTKKNRLAIMTRAREIISDKKRWTQGRLRRKIKGQYRYCLVGACEQAVYELGLAEPREQAFLEAPSWNTNSFGYDLALEVSIHDFAKRTTKKAPHVVNDEDGYEATIALTDAYIAELKQPTPKS